jgi:hypothetical protein
MVTGHSHGHGLTSRSNTIQVLESRLGSGNGNGHERGGDDGDGGSDDAGGFPSKASVKSGFTRKHPVDTSPSARLLQVKSTDGFGTLLLAVAVVVVVLSAAKY